MDASIEMDNLILIIKIIVWPFMFLLLGALFMFLFKKPIGDYSNKIDIGNIAWISVVL